MYRKPFGEAGDGPPFSFLILAVMVYGADEADLCLHTWLLWKSVCVSVGGVEGGGGRGVVGVGAWQG